MERDQFADISWQTTPHGNTQEGEGSSSNAAAGEARPSVPSRMASGSGNDGAQGDPLDLAGIGHGSLECTVSHPLKENDGSKDAYVSFQVTTKTDFPSFQKPVTTVRRRFTDFVFLYTTLSSEYPQCAVPPLPDKHSMMYVTGDRFSPDFTHRRAKALDRFLKRLTQHPVLRRSALLIIFLESQDWNATMRQRPGRSASNGEPPAGVFDGITETFINAFTKVHKPDKRFIEVREKSDKLDEDLGHIEKILVRVVRREDELGKDFHELADNFKKLVMLEPGVEEAVHGFTAGVEDQSRGIRELKEATDHDYLGSLRDMQSYSGAIKALLKLREAKQVDFEQTAVLLADTTSSRDRLANSAYGGGGPTSFIRSKIEDVRGVDHEQARRKRLREAELKIEELTKAVEESKKLSEAFDEEVVREVADFERIKRAEFKQQLGGLADAHIHFFSETIEVWEKYMHDMEKEGVLAA